MCSRISAALHVFRESLCRRMVLVLFVVLAFMFGIGRLVYEIQPWKDPTNVTRLLDSAGPFAPVMYATVIGIAVIVPPVPDTVPVLVAGVGFGAVLGTVYSLIGITVGAIISFYLARRFGRRLIRRYVPRTAIERLDAYVPQMGWGVLFIGNLIGVNSGLISYAAGLAQMRFPAFLSATFLGVLPQIVIITATGQALHGQSTLLLVGAAGLMLFLATARAASQYLMKRRAQRRNEGP